MRRKRYPVLVDHPNLFLGTCSWTDKSLVDSGLFYPPSVKTPEERLRFYASQFPVVEVDSSYYGMPSERNSALWVERTPDPFLFHFKAFSPFTHHPTPPRALPKDMREALPQALQQRRSLYLRDLSGELIVELWARFESALLPLDSAGKLGLVLLQFPRWFLPGSDSLGHIQECRRRLPQYRLAVEFRNASWLSDRNRERALRFLEEHRLAFVAVDEPQGFQSSVPPVAVATSDVAYVRFHGRNADTWEKRGATASDRFDYYYTDRELQEWVPRVRSLQAQAREVHHDSLPPWRGKAWPGQSVVEGMG